jgi:SM-20-related protein
VSGAWALSDAEVQALGGAGFFVRDGFLGPELAQAAHAAAVALQVGGRYRPAGLRREHTLDRSVRDDETLWVDQSIDAPALAEVARAFEALRQSVNQEAWLGLTRFDLQLAHYGPGGHYDKHLDAFPGDDNRRLTALVYLNPGWEPSHGGQLRVHGEPTVDVAPVLDRLVVFLSAKVEHEVLASQAERYACAAWYSAK